MSQACLCLLVILALVRQRIINSKQVWVGYVVRLINKNRQTGPIMSMIVPFLELNTRETIVGQVMIVPYAG